MPEVILIRTSYDESGASIFAIRNQVFVIEQSVPLEIEIDELDPVARHVLAYLDRPGGDCGPAGTGRITIDGKIGRMAVLSEFRGQGVGAAILDGLIRIAIEDGLDTVSLSAQCHAIAFYERFGFVAEGPVYQEAGIDHRWMTRSLGIVEDS